MLPEKQKDQHIIVDREVNEKIVSTASIVSSDKVLEIGGGPGNLTALLAKRAQYVYTVENDKRYFSMLSKRFSGSSTVKIIFGNILDIETPEFNKIVSNPPFQILQQFFFKLVKEGRQNFECCVMVTPHRFTKLITERPETAGFGVLSALFYAFYDVEAITTVSKGSFNPEPRVTSYLVKITPKIDIGTFPIFVFRNIFLQNNKKIGNIILGALWDNGEKLIGRRLTKREAKQLISKASNSRLLPILDKNVFQLSNNEVKILYESLLEMQKTDF